MKEEKKVKRALTRSCCNYEDRTRINNINFVLTISDKILEQRRNPAYKKLI